MRTVTTILTISIITIISSVSGQESLTDQNDIKKPSLYWTDWKADTSAFDQGTKQIVKKRQRYIRSGHGWVTEEINFQYDKCGNLVRKTKVRIDLKCHGVAGKVKYDHTYRRNCNELTTERKK